MTRNQNPTTRSTILIDETRFRESHAPKEFVINNRTT
jgi:hypothetical protein